MAASDAVSAENRRETAEETARRIVLERDGALGGLVATLEAVQHALGYLPEEALRGVAAATGRPLVDVYGVATFYRSFRFEPRGAHSICVCMGTACHVRGAPMVAAEFERRLGVKSGGTTPDGQVTLETVNCLGACAIGPVALIDGQIHANLTVAQVGRVLARLRAQSSGAQSGNGRPSISPRRARQPRRSLVAA